MILAFQSHLFEMYYYLFYYIYIDLIQNFWEMCTYVRLYLNLFIGYVLMCIVV